MHRGNEKAYTILRRLFGRYWFRREDIIKVTLEEIDCKHAD
jgi:hypothetical protein